MEIARNCQRAVGKPRSGLGVLGEARIEQQRGQCQGEWNKISLMKLHGMVSVAMTEPGVPGTMSELRVFIVSADCPSLYVDTRVATDHGSFGTPRRCNGRD